MKTVMNKCDGCGKEIVSRRSLINGHTPLAYIELSTGKKHCRECIQ